MPSARIWMAVPIIRILVRINVDTIVDEYQKKRHLILSRVNPTLFYLNRN